ncbi:MAG: phosphatidylserine decarboxylase [Verrucomicrobiaceae bacterium]|nr:phosphatidylserine decarboxylase [Verrucomicrobiaceae bacterium]
MNGLFILFQYLVPQHLLSRAAGWLADSELPLIKRPFIRWFIQRYNVDMSEAADPEPEHYASFNAFFTRALRPGARPLDLTLNGLISPADGAVSQAGRIESGRIVQAKGQWFSALELVGGDAELAAQFADGEFATIYLSPRDYHRVHMPFTGTLTQMIYVPGDLFSVNQTTAENVPRLFARNERLVCIFDTAHGPAAVILVGAMIVAGIETVWAGQIAPPPRRAATTHYDRQVSVVLEKGAEMGRFKLGSTVVLLLGKDAVQWTAALNAGQNLRMGELIGQAR